MPRKAIKRKGTGPLIRRSKRNKLPSESSDFGDTSTDSAAIEQICLDDNEESILEESEADQDNIISNQIKPDQVDDLEESPVEPSAEEREASVDEKESSVDEQEAGVAKHASVDEKEASVDEQDAPVDEQETLVNKQKLLGDEEEASVNEQESSIDKQEVSQETSVDERESSIDKQEVSQETSVDEQEASVDEQGASVDEKEASVDEQEASVDEQEASGDEQEASGDEQEASVEEQEVSVEEQEASVDEQEASVDEQEASVEVQEASVEVQEASVEVQEASVEVQEVSVELQEASVEVQEASDVEQEADDQEDLAEELEAAIDAQEVISTEGDKITDESSNKNATVDEHEKETICEKELIGEDIVTIDSDSSDSDVHKLRGNSLSEISHSEEVHKSSAKKPGDVEEIDNQEKIVETVTNKDLNLNPPASVEIEDDLNEELSKDKSKSRISLRLRNLDTNKLESGSDENVQDKTVPESHSEKDITVDIVSKEKVSSETSSVQLVASINDKSGVGDDKNDDAESRDISDVSNKVIPKSNVNQEKSNDQTDFLKVREEAFAHCTEDVETDDRMELLYEGDESPFSSDSESDSAMDATPSTKDDASSKAVTSKNKEKTISESKKSVLRDNEASAIMEVPIEKFKKVIEVIDLDDDEEDKGKEESSKKPSTEVSSDFDEMSPLKDPIKIRESFVDPLKDVLLKVKSSLVQIAIKQKSGDNPAWVLLKHIDDKVKALIDSVEAQTGKVYAFASKNDAANNSALEEALRPDLKGNNAEEMMTELTNGILLVHTALEHLKTTVDQKTVLLNQG